MKEAVSDRFKKLFGETPSLYRSPGRVNLIGEHTDYNEGFVLPAAINKEMVFAIAPSGSSNCRVFAENLEQEVSFSLDDLSKSDKGWANYLIGTAAQFVGKGQKIEGFNLVFGGNIPIGSGLSSSAALECGLAFALNDLNGVGNERLDLALMAQKAEHEYAGVMCGIMDQFASVFGKAESAIRLDCRSLEKAYFPIHIEGYKILLLDTGVKHSLASSEYNTRRQECEEGVGYFRQTDPSIKSLRDIRLDMLESANRAMAPIVYKRCHYVLKENQRLMEACEALEQDDLNTFGEKMYGSHAGLRDEYEVSCPELDFLVDFTENEPGVLGARMMGGGFGGCTINLTAADAVKDLVKRAGKAYQQKTGIELKAYVMEIVDGSSKL